MTDRFDPDENPRWEPDALVEVTFSQRELPVRNGYRPHYKVKKDYLTTTLHWFIENGEAKPNIATLAFVKFITPEAYPYCLEVGQQIEVGEGCNSVGFALVKEIYNQELQKVG